jgi:hypothetical protein
VDDGVELIREVGRAMVAGALGPRHVDGADEALEPLALQERRRWSRSFNTSRNAGTRRFRGTAKRSCLGEPLGDNGFVPLSASTHGAGEFYQERAPITRRLIEEMGFTVVAVEGDWTDAGDSNEFIHGDGSTRDGEDRQRQRRQDTGVRQRDHGDKQAEDIRDERSHVGR